MEELATDLPINVFSSFYPLFIVVCFTSVCVHTLTF